MYGKLAGMTGTADTEAYEFQDIYGLETVVIPTHRPMIREDRRTRSSAPPRRSTSAIINDIKDCHERGQPVLVGTTSIENSELLSRHADKESLPHQVLNAKQHAREAEIVAQAGRPEDDHHRHQHGRPRHRHRAGRQCRKPDRSSSRPTRRVAEDEKQARIAKLRERVAALHDQVDRRRAACTSSAPSATSRAASTTSCAAARAARATRARRVSTCRWTTRCCASSPATACRRSWTG